MKNILSILILTFAMPTTATFLESPTEFPAAPSEVYAPQGFDSNDNVEIFFEGEFTNACYKVGMTFHTVDKEEKNIYVTDMAYYFGQDFCAAVMVPYQKGINAGILNSGNYKIHFRHSRGNFVETGMVPVKLAQSSSPDDYLYAPVEKSIYIPGQNHSPGTLKLLGHFTNSCMELNDVKVVTYNDKNVVDILPIAQMGEKNCIDEPDRPFEFNVDLSQHISKGRYLLHVRVLNGQSVNQIVSVL